MTERPDDRGGGPTRAVLERTAIDLFDRYGFEAVTTSQIAEAAGYSPRTYFRHFASKDDALFQDPGPWLQRLLELLRQQPHELDPISAVHAALAEEAATATQSPLDVQRKRVVRSTPSLAHKVREVEDALEATLALWLAERTGAEPDDFEIEVAAALLVAARRVVTRRWSEHADEMSMIDLTSRALETFDIHL